MYVGYNIYIGPTDLKLHMISEYYRMCARRGIHTHALKYTHKCFLIYYVDVQLNTSLSTNGSRCRRNQKRLLILFFTRSSLFSSQAFMRHAEADAGGWSQAKSACCELGCFICLHQLRAMWLAIGKLIKASSRLHTNGVAERRVAMRGGGGAGARTTNQKMRCGSHNHKCANISRTSRRSENKYIRVHTYEHTHILSRGRVCLQTCACAYVRICIKVSMCIQFMYALVC